MLGENDEKIFLVKPGKAPICILHENFIPWDSGVQSISVASIRKEIASGAVKIPSVVYTDYDASNDNVWRAGGYAGDRMTM